MEEGRIREKERNIRTALLLRTVLQTGTATTLDIAEVFMKERGMRRKAALNMAFSMAEELTKYGVLERIGEGKPFRYRLTPLGIFYLLFCVRNKVTAIFNEDLVLDYIIRMDPSLSLIITGYRKLRPLLPKKAEEEEEEEVEEDVYGSLTWAIKEGLWEGLVITWNDVLEETLKPLVEFILEDETPIPENLPVEAREALKKAVELAEKSLKEEKEELKKKEERLAMVKTLITKWP